MKKTAVAAALRAGERIVVFPEGTTTDGTALKRFHPALFQAALDAGVAVVPIAIRYVGADGRPSRAVPFVDDMTFVGSLLRVIREPIIRAEVAFGRPSPVDRDASSPPRRSGRSPPVSGCPPPPSSRP